MNRDLAFEEAFDVLSRQTVLAAFGPVAIIPIEAGKHGFLSS